MMMILIIITMIIMMIMPIIVIIIVIIIIIIIIIITVFLNLERWLLLIRSRKIIRPLFSEPRVFVLLHL